MTLNIQDISWAGQSNFPYALALLAVVVVLLGVKVFRGQRVINKLTSVKWRDVQLPRYSRLKLLFKVKLFIVGFLFLCLALLRPQWDKQEEHVEQEGRDLLIALDISRSMLGQDEEPNRLEFAKAKIKKLLYNLSCERVGLILFSGATVMQCPLTTDYGAFFMFLDQIDVETISSGTTAIDQAIHQAITVFDSMATKKTKLLCLFTDGEDFSSNLTGVKEKANEQGVSIFAIGIGSEHGAPVPIIDSEGKQIGFEKDDTGNVFMSKLNEGILRNLAQKTGGKYIHATQSDKDIKELITAVGKFEKDALEGKSVSRLQEKYNYFVALSFLCFVIEWLL